MAALRGGRTKLPAGKVLGGSSMLNFMVYLRGHRRDFDEWEEMGNDGWGYRDVLPYFKRSEDFVPAGEEGEDGADREFHGSGGPVKVQPTPFVYPAAEVVADGLREMGLREGDLNGEMQVGLTCVNLQMV